MGFSCRNLKNLCLRLCLVNSYRFLSFRVYSKYSRTFSCSTDRSYYSASSGFILKTWRVMYSTWIYEWGGFGTPAADCACSNLNWERMSSVVSCSYPILLMSIKLSLSCQNRQKSQLIHMGKYIHLGLIEIYYYQMFSRFISSTFSYSHFSILTNAISQG